MALNFYAQNWILLWTTALLTVIFGAFTLLELVRSESGNPRRVALLYYELLSAASGVPVMKWIGNMKMANKMLQKLGMMQFLVDAVREEDSPPLGLWLAKYKHAGIIACLVTSVIVGALGFIVAFG